MHLLATRLYIYRHSDPLPYNDIMAYTEYVYEGSTIEVWVLFPWSTEGAVA